MSTQRLSDTLREHYLELPKMPYDLDPQRIWWSFLFVFSLFQKFRIFLDSWVWLVKLFQEQGLRWGEEGGEGKMGGRRTYIKKKIFSRFSKISMHLLYNHRTYQAVLSSFLLSSAKHTKFLFRVISSPKNVSSLWQKIWRREREREREKWRERKERKCIRCFPHHHGKERRKLCCLKMSIWNDWDRSLREISFPI